MKFKKGIVYEYKDGRVFEFVCESNVYFHFIEIINGQKTDHEFWKNKKTFNPSDWKPYHDLPLEFNRNDYEVHKYMSRESDTPRSSKHLTIDNFDSIQLIEYPSNDVEKPIFEHAIGRNIQSGRPTFLILKKKPIAERPIKEQFQSMLTDIVTEKLTVDEAFESIEVIKFKK